ncbi:MAG: hypothetical protein A2Y17_03140 [Clostridiales bacterium GWF2_38_85]|nr:MAG: hypothetical protein A2Y17_03140 [Clostridiales bacterium GWF2_38_85]
MNGNKISKIQKITRDNLSNEFYLQSLLQEALSCKIISEAEYKKILENLIKLLAEETQKFTKGESSSVRTETAKAILDSMCYKISIYLKSINNCDAAVLILLERPLRDILSSGNKLIESKLKVVVSLYKKINKNRINTPNNAYNDTIGKGLKLFFKEYDKDFESNETPVAIDYPLCIECSNYVGVEFIINYMISMYWENVFCSYFVDTEIHSIMQSINHDYEGLLVNIFEQTLLNSLANIIIGKPDKLKLYINDITDLYGTLKIKSDSELRKLFSDAAAEYKTQIVNFDDYLRNYISKAIDKFLPSILHALHTNTLDKIFATENNTEKSDIIHIINEKRISDEKFRELVDEIRTCENISDKITMIMAVSSIKDLIDILEANCFFGDEYLKLFTILDEVEFALLNKASGIKSERGEDHEWQGYFNEYYSKLSNTIKSKIILNSELLPEIDI